MFLQANLLWFSCLYVLSAINVFNTIDKASWCSKHVQLTDVSCFCWKMSFACRECSCYIANWLLMHTSMQRITHPVFYLCLISRRIFRTIMKVFNSILMLMSILVLWICVYKPILVNASRGRNSWAILIITDLN